MEFKEVEELLNEVTTSFNRLDGRISHLFDAANDNAKSIEQLRREHYMLKKYLFWLSVVNIGFLFFAIRVIFTC